MFYKAKNTMESSVFIEDSIAAYFDELPFLKNTAWRESMRIAENVFPSIVIQERKLTGGYRIETHNLFGLAALRFAPKPASSARLYLTANDGNPLNISIDNMRWVSLPDAIKETRKPAPPRAYRGVRKERDGYRAVIYHNGKALNLGMFDTPEEAAKAHNAKSIELYGNNRSLNKIP